MDKNQSEASPKSTMPSRKAKWLMYTVAVGLLPAMLRLLIWLSFPDRNIDILNAVDFILFGLVLHISNINEIEHFNDDEGAWKTFQNGISLIFVALYGGLYASHLFGDAGLELLIVSITLGIVSFVISFTVYNRTSEVDAR